MIRPALAAIVFCATLLAALAQMAPGVGSVPEASGGLGVEQPAIGCPLPHDDGDWNPLFEAAASITESAWKWRTLHVGLSAAAPRVTIAAIVPADSPRSRAPASPPYLLHTPLLI